MNLSDLSKSPTEMTNEELSARLAEIRANRSVRKPSSQKRTKVASTKTSLEKSIGKLSADELQELINTLEQAND